MEVQRLRIELEDIPNQMAQFTSESSEMTKQMEMDQNLLRRQSLTRLV